MSQSSGSLITLINSAQGAQLCWQENDENVLQLKIF